MRGVRGSYDREREREREGVNERVIDRIVIRRTILDGLRGLGHLMHVVPSPWIRAGPLVNERRKGEGEREVGEDRLFRMEVT